MSSPTFEIPGSVLRWLDQVPTDRPVAMLVRHSVRPSLPDGDVGYAVAITDEGRRIATELGQRLGARLRSVRSSPVHRCMQTASAMVGGAGLDLPVHADRLLGDPGVFVIDGRAAMPHWIALTPEGMVKHQLSEDEPLPGMAAPAPAARFLVHAMLAHTDGEPGIHAFVTHDAIVVAAAGRMLEEKFGYDSWPWFLEAAFFWRDETGVCAAYRDHYRGDCATGPLCGLGEADVIELARREVTAVVGAACRARFFLAGGAFKSLLTGRPPRDLDLWAASLEDREMLLAHLHDRGARAIPGTEFADSYEVAGRRVDLPRKTAYPTLEERLATFDIALSAVGVEHRPGGGWRAVVHPLAHESVRRREVLLLEPLANWKYALATLVRLRRYARELGFAVTAVQEQAVWDVFDMQEPEMQAGMIDRLHRAAPGARDVDAVAREAECRRRRQ